MKRTILILQLSCLLSLTAYSQTHTDFNGYLSGMPNIIVESYGDSSATKVQTIVHNRLNFNYYLGDRLSGSAQLRTQVWSGDLYESSQFPKGIETESYFLPLTYFGHMGNNTVLYSSLDRLWFKYTHDNLELTLGRQRINWGQTFVWNSNDIFNSYNFFDFDYEERPGADAVRLEYYTGMTSKLEAAIKLDSANNITAAGLFRFNKYNYDIQFIAGYYESTFKPDFFNNEQAKDIVVGAGWSGDFFGLSFRGEMSYFQAISNSADSLSKFVGSWALDHTFSSESYVSFEFLYNDVQRFQLTDLQNFYGGVGSAKNLSFTKYNFLGQVSHPISPILNVSFAAMYFFQSSFDGFYAGPIVNYSLSENVQLSGIYQFFGYKETQLTQNKWLNTKFAYARLKWNF